MSASAKRRGRGDGSLFYDKSRDRWIGQLPGGKDPDTGKRKRGPKVSARTKAGARELLRQLERDHAVTGVAARRDVTVEAIMRDLLANPPATWRARTTFQVNTDLAGRIIKGLGKSRVATLTPGDVERFLRGMAGEGLATATISATRGLLAKAIRRAQRDNLVGRNVAELAETPRGKRAKSRSMNREQIEALFASDLTAWWRAYCTVGILCGLRPGELLGLTWQDIDFAAGLIRVRHCLKANDAPDGATVLVLEDLKTERSKRTLQLPARAVEVLKALKAVQAADRLRLGRFYEDRGLVFCNNAGQPKWRSSVNGQFKVICDRAGIGSDWHLHEQRHTFVSMLSDHGLDIEVIADAAGHINSNVTRTVYRHSIADKVSKAATAMDEIFGRVTGA
ncbi:MAG: tyrosine-type recombinase/integrase [Streptosporangiaceae bacterium]